MNPAGRSALREGIVAGLIGAAVVAIWFFVFDILRGRLVGSLDPAAVTPQDLGAAMTGGGDE